MKLLDNLFKNGLGKNDSNKEKQQRIKRIIPKTAQQTIPYLRAYEDGIFQVTNNSFSKVIRFYDINYQIARQDDKEDILLNTVSF